MGHSGPGARTAAERAAHSERGAEAIRLLAAPYPGAAADEDRLSPTAGPERAGASTAQMDQRSEREKKIGTVTPFSDRAKSPDPLSSLGKPDALVGHWLAAGHQGR